MKKILKRIVSGVLAAAMAVTGLVSNMTPMTAEAANITVGSSEGFWYYSGFTGDGYYAFCMNHKKSAYDNKSMTTTSCSVTQEAKSFQMTAPIFQRQKPFGSICSRLINPNIPARIVYLTHQLVMQYVMV